MRGRSADDKLSVAMSEVENMVDLDTDNHIELMLAEFIKLETLLEDYAGDFDQDLSRTLHMQSTHTLNEWLSRCSLLRSSLAALNLPS